MVARLYLFIFIQISIYHYPDKTPRFVTSDLGLHSHEKDTKLIWVNTPCKATAKRNTVEYNLAYVIRYSVTDICED